jgi:hypothetical protein
MLSKKGESKRRKADQGCLWDAPRLAVLFHALCVRGGFAGFLFLVPLILLCLVSLASVFVRLCLGSGISSLAGSGCRSALCICIMLRARVSRVSLHPDSHVTTTWIPSLVRLPCSFAASSVSSFSMRGSPWTSRRGQTIPVPCPGLAWSVDTHALRESGGARSAILLVLRRGQGEGEGKGGTHSFLASAIPLL